MSRDEIHGYVLDLALCRNGQLTESWNFLYVTFDENVGIQKATYIDEAGCTEPSRAHIITYGRRGFAEWEKIFWPPH